MIYDFDRCWFGLLWYLASLNILALFHQNFIWVVNFSVLPYPHWKRDKGDSVVVSRKQHVQCVTYIHFEICSLCFSMEYDSKEIFCIIMQWRKIDFVVTFKLSFSLLNHVILLNTREVEPACDLLLPCSFEKWQKSFWVLKSSITEIVFFFFFFKGEKPPPANLEKT